MRDLATYSFANAKIRAMLSRLMPPEDISRLLSARDITEVFENLKNTPYAYLAQRFSGAAFDLAAIERELTRNDLALYRKIHDMIPARREREYIAILLSRYEIEELKTVLRSWHTKRDFDLEGYLLGETVCHEIDYKKIMAAQTIEEIILVLDATPYKKPLMEARDRYKERKNSFYLEAALDFDYYVRQRAAIARLSFADRAIALRILGVEIDAENINWLIRLRQFSTLGIGEVLPLLIPGGERITSDAVRAFYATDGLGKVVESVALGPYARIKDLAHDNIALIEGFLYEILLREVRRVLAGFPFTIGTVLGFLILKRRETRNIKSILCGKNYGLSSDALTPLLRLD